MRKCYAMLLQYLRNALTKKKIIDDRIILTMKEEAMQAARSLSNSKIQMLSNGTSYE